MRTIGLVGGMSWESTAVYYRLLNEGVRDRLGGHHSAELLLRSVDFAGVEALQAAGEWPALGRRLAAAAVALERAGADCVALATNTMHLVADDVTAACRLPLVHIVDAVASVLTRHGCARVGVLGTAYTMTSPLYADGLRPYGVEVVVPDDADRALVHRVVYDELVHGVVTEAARTAYLAVVDRLAAAGADAVVLGCTEIGLLLQDGDAAVPLVDSAQAHVDALLEHSLSRPDASLEVTA